MVFHSYSVSSYPLNMDSLLSDPSSFFGCLMVNDIKNELKNLIRCPKCSPRERLYPTDFSRDTLNNIITNLEVYNPNIEQLLSATTKQAHNQYPSNVKSEWEFDLDKGLSVLLTDKLNEFLATFIGCPFCLNNNIANISDQWLLEIINTLYVLRYNYQFDDLLENWNGIGDISFLKNLTTFTITKHKVGNESWNSLAFQYSNERFGKCWSIIHDTN